MSMYNETTYERYKKQIEEEIKECESEARCYWNDPDPKYVNAVNDALWEKSRLETLLKFIEDNKKELDKW